RNCPRRRTADQPRRRPSSTSPRFGLCWPEIRRSVARRGQPEWIAAEGLPERVIGVIAGTLLFQVARFLSSAWAVLADRDSIVRIAPMVRDGLPIDRSVIMVRLAWHVERWVWRDLRPGREYRPDLLMVRAGPAEPPDRPAPPTWRMRHPS